MPPSRREFLLSGLSATALSACGNSVLPALPAVSAGNSTPLVQPDKDFDFPTVAPLPFGHGVASGDPLSDRVMIWTRITLITPAEVPVQWQVSSTPDFASILKQGTQTCLAQNDYTVKVDVIGLQPSSTYYYRFTALGETSLIGRTRTATTGMIDNLRFAVAACSSYWSSTWSGYDHIAKRNDLDLVLHCGDYIYDFIDEDEFLRARNNNRDLAHPDNRDWLNLDELRRRYALFRSDPALCRAHQQHPWFIVWDNHDIDPTYGNELATPFDGMKGSTTLEQCCQAFWEWTPSRPVQANGEFILVEDGSYPTPSNVKHLWRTLPYGDLATFIGMDQQIGLPGYQQTLDASHLPTGTPTLLGKAQFDYVVNTLKSAQSQQVRWKVLNSQAWFAPIDTPNVVAGAPNTPKIGVSRWSDYAGERAAFCRALRTAGIRGAVLVSGDSHGNMASDVIEENSVVSAYQSGAMTRSTRNGSTPENTGAGYLRATSGNTLLLNNRALSVGVEFAPSSLGRGGADEIVQNANPSNPFAANVAGARAIEQAVVQGNKNVQFLEWVDHGYGIVDLKADRALFECWWQNKLVANSPDILGMQLISFAADNPTALPQPRYRDQIDAVSVHNMAVVASVGTRMSAPAPENVTLVAR